MNTKKRTWKWQFLGLLAICAISCESAKGNTSAIKEEIARETSSSKTAGKDSASKEKAVETCKIDTAAWKALPHKWVGLERSNSGYVVYKPCDGVTPTFDLDSLKLKIAGQWQDGVITFSIKDFQKIGNNEYQIISEEEGWSRLELNLKRVKPSLDLWLLNGFIKREKKRHSASTYLGSDHEDEFNKIPGDQKSMPNPENHGERIFANRV